MDRKNGKISNREIDSDIKGIGIGWLIKINLKEKNMYLHVHNRTKHDIFCSLETFFCNFTKILFFLGLTVEFGNFYLNLI